MQIDFHHAVTYTVTRLAGLTHAQARTVAMPPSTWTTRWRMG